MKFLKKILTTILLVIYLLVSSDTEIAAGFLTPDCKVSLSQTSVTPGDTTITQIILTIKNTSPLRKSSKYTLVVKAPGSREYQFDFQTKSTDTIINIDISGSPMVNVPGVAYTYEIKVIQKLVGGGELAAGSGCDGAIEGKIQAPPQIVPQSQEKTTSIKEQEKANLDKIQEAAGLKGLTTKGFVGTLITKALPFIIGAAGLLLLLYLIWGGIGVMLSQGDPRALEAARGRITAAVIGFIIVFIAYWLVQILGNVLGIAQFKEVFR